MTLVQAILIAALYWLDAGEIFVPFTYCFCDLMFVSMLTGLILGDITTGVIVGGTIQPLYLALTAVGGALPVDKVAAGVVTTSMVITQGISLEEGLVISSAAALICAQLHTVKRVAMLWTVHHADKCAEYQRITAHIINLRTINQSRYLLDSNDFNFEIWNGQLRYFIKWSAGLGRKYVYGCRRHDAGARLCDDDYGYW